MGIMKGFAQQSAEVDARTKLVGKDRDRVYYGYFEHSSVLQWFNHILQSDVLKQRRADMTQQGVCDQLGIGDGNGNLTNFLEQSLQNDGLKVYTISTDISQDQINGNTNEGSIKQVLDISTQDPSLLFNKTFDLISTRSIFHYMGDLDAIQHSLLHIKSSLSKKGVYILQEVTCDNEVEINLIKDIFGLFGKPVVFLTHDAFNNEISKYFSVIQPKSSYHYQMSLHSSELYRQMGELYRLFKGGDSSIVAQGPGLFIEQEEFLKRYDSLYDPKSGEIPVLKDAIIKLIEEVPEEQRPNILLRNGRFGIYFYYTTLICSHK